MIIYETLGTSFFRIYTKNRQKVTLSFWLGMRMMMELYL